MNLKKIESFKGIAHKFYVYYKKGERKNKQEDLKYIAKLLSKSIFTTNFLLLLGDIKKDIDAEQQHEVKKYLNFSLLPQECQKGNIHVLSLLLGIKPICLIYRKKFAEIAIKNQDFLNELFTGILKFSHDKNFVIIERLWAEKEGDIKINQWFR